MATVWSQGMRLGAKGTQAPGDMGWEATSSPARAQHTGVPNLHARILKRNYEILKNNLTL